MFRPDALASSPIRVRPRGSHGMITAEYAVATLGAVSVAACLCALAGGDGFLAHLLESIFRWIEFVTDVRTLPRIQIL
ncbi:MAG: DUF4244 domain-containing protein [Nocardioidaceae bacterium]